MTTPADLSFEIDALHRAYREGLTPGDVIEEVYRRIAQADDDGIFLHLRDKADLLAEAAMLGPFDPGRQPLWGVPFAIKDNIDLGGVPTTAACPAYAYTPARDAFVVAALRQAGALAIGKTNLDQFATGLVGMRTPYPAPRNALDPAMVPGGSSSGSAVAVARGIVSFALGTDTAGSGRVPAALNNIVGLKPTLGVLSGTGVVPACRTLDTVSVFALTVGDAWRAFEAGAVFDAADAFARRIGVPALGAPPAHPVIGVPDAATREFFGDRAQAASFDAALARLEHLGARIEEIDFTPFFQIARMLYEGAWVAERMTVIEQLMRENPAAIHPVTRRIVHTADGMMATDAFRGIYRLAELRRAAEPALAGLDLLCVPTMPTFCTVAELEADPVGPNTRLGTYTNFVNLMDLCGIAVPCGPREDGRPGGVTLLARAGRDALAASVAAALHADARPLLGATSARLAAPVAPQAGVAAGEVMAVTADEVALAVVGAHMSGLPLNRELTERGARLVAATHTAPHYRLHALPGGPPARPGLLRVAADGTAIALEVWALPRTAVGDFIAGIPAPLTIGSVALADGTSVKGFLVENCGIAGAHDISGFGGWRAYLSEAVGAAG